MVRGAETGGPAESGAFTRPYKDADECMGSNPGQEHFAP